MIKNQTTKLFWFLYIAVLFIYLLFINIMTPMMGEDFALINSSDNKIELSKSLLKSIKNAFNPYSPNFNLRLGDTLSSILQNTGKLFGIGKILFDILNTIVILIFITLIFFWSYCRLPNINDLNDLLSFSLIPSIILICSFSIGEIFFWLTGATNYLWCGTILLSIGVPYRKYLNNELYTIKSSFIPVFIIFSFIAGFTNENTVPIIILLGGFLLLKDIIKKGIKKIPLWLFTSILSMGIGYSILIFSPNTKRRSAFYREFLSLPENITINEIVDNTKGVILSFISGNIVFIILLFIVSLFFLFYLIYKKSENNITLNYSNNIIYENIFLLFISSISVIALFFAPYREIRSFFFVQLFIIILFLQFNNFFISNIKNGIQKYLIYIPAIFLSVLSLYFLVQFTYWTLDFSKFTRERNVSIINQINNGNKDIIVNLYKINRNKYINTREISIIDDGGIFFNSIVRNVNNITWENVIYKETEQ
jgi:hypothetical protein